MKRDRQLYIHHIRLCKFQNIQIHMMWNKLQHIPLNKKCHIPWALLQQLLLLPANLPTQWHQE